MASGVSGQLPSEVPDAHWVFAHAPGRPEPEEGRSGKWMLFVPNEQVDA